jgi:rubrerythrin
MAGTSQYNKEKIIGEFEMMREMELSAKDLYTKIAALPDIERQLKIAFTAIALDEQRHADIVRKIITLITNTL